MEFQPKTAVVRNLPVSFINCLKEHAPLTPIDLDLAHRQHDEYVRTVASLVPNSVQLPADESLPDCCFIEDTAVVIGDLAAISFLGALERRGEERLVEKTLHELGVRTVAIEAPGTLDGGDVLFTGSHIVVGLSRRTNAEAAQQLAKIFPYPVVTVPVTGTLHLKSVLSSFDRKTILFGECEAARKIAKHLEPMLKEYKLQFLPDAIAANVLSMGANLVIQDGFPRSEVILQGLAKVAGKKIHKLQMSEFIKADGALTCCSLLF